MKAKNPAELVEIAQLCRYMKWYAQAARYYRAALAANPKLAVYSHRYDAASAAALAAADQNLADEEKSRMRGLALTWLRTDLAIFTQALEADPQKAGLVRDNLRHWLANPDLAGIRGEKALALLPEAEGNDWRRFWAEIEQVEKGIRN